MSNMVNACNGSAAVVEARSCDAPRGLRLFPVSNWEVASCCIGAGAA